MATSRDLLLARLAMVRQDLDEALDTVGDLPMTWAPAPGVRTLGGLIAEIVATELQLGEMLRQAKLSNFSTLEKRSTPKTLEDGRSLLTATREGTLAALAAFSDAELEEEVSVPKGGWEGLGAAKISRAELLRSLAAHEWYHTGQLVTSLWTAGRDPYA